MREGSPPHRVNQILFINYRRRGQTYGCSRAGQRCGLEPVEGEYDKAMKYGLFAEFYENSSDEKPRHTVFMGCQNLHDGKLVEKDNATQQDLEKLTDPEYDKEMINVLFDQDYERIRIVARAITKGSYPPEFYYRLSDWGRKVFKENKRPLSERFIKLGIVV